MRPHTIDKTIQRHNKVHFKSSVIRDIALVYLVLHTKSNCMEKILWTHQYCRIKVTGSLDVCWTALLQLFLFDIPALHNHQYKICFLRGYFLWDSPHKAKSRAPGVFSSARYQHKTRCCSRLFSAPCNNQRVRQLCNDVTHCQNYCAMMLIITLEVTRFM